MKMMQKLIEQNDISQEAAAFLQACIHAQLNILIWSTSITATVMSRALKEFSDNAIIVDLGDITPEHDHGLIIEIGTLVNELLMPTAEDIKKIKARIKVEIIIVGLVDAILDVSSEQSVPIFLKPGRFDNTIKRFVSSDENSANRLSPTGLRPPVLEKLDEANIVLPPTVFGLGISPPEPEPAPEETAEEEEEDLIVFGDVDDELDDEIAIEPPVEKSRAESKPQPPPAPPQPVPSFGISDRNLTPPDEEIDERKHRRTEDTGDTKTKEAQFTAYYARQSAANTEYGFYVYAHLPDALISADIQQFAPDLGGRIPKPAIAKQTATLKEGSLLTAMVQCDALEFNQIGIMKKWEAPFVRFDFRYTAPESLVDEFVEGRVAIMLGMIEIASIDFQTLITAPQQINLINTLPDDPTQQAHFEPTNPASMYQKIFISYSRKDTFVAEEFRKAQIMMGNTVFMDTHTIRAGEDWEEALKRFIREADVFQLFWSEHSASSDHVKFEWEYALNHRCSETRCVGFIRPAYWEKPLSTPPSELGHLHFAYVPQEAVS